MFTAPDKPSSLQVCFAISPETGDKNTQAYEHVNASRWDCRHVLCNSRFTRPELRHRLVYHRWWRRHKHGRGLFRQRNNRTTGRRAAYGRKLCHRWRLLGVCWCRADCGRTVVDHRAPWRQRSCVLAVAGDGLRAGSDYHSERAAVVLASSRLPLPNERVAHQHHDASAGRDEILSAKEAMMCDEPLSCQHH